MFSMVVVGARLEALEDFGICPFSLAVAPWVGHGGIENLDTKIVAAVLATGDLCPIVGDEPVWDPEPAHDGFDKLDCILLVNIDHRCCLRPFGELINCDVQVTVPADSFWERSQDIQTLYGEWP